MKETKKVKENSFSKGKGKGNVSKTNQQRKRIKGMFQKNNIRKHLDTIVDPSNKPYYCGSDCNFN